MRFSFIPAAFAISIMLVGTAAASAIYKSIDADGNVFFTDKPISESSEQLEIQFQARLQHQATAAEAAANAPAGPTEDEKRAEARERAEKCSMYKERQFRFTRSRRIYREDSDGERVYLDEQEMGEVRANVEDQIEEYCS